MFQSARLILLSLLVNLIISGCVKEEDRSVKISLVKLKDKNGRVDLTATDVLNLDTLLLATTTSDSSGNAFLSLSLDKPLFAQLRSGDQFVQLFLSPGDELSIAYDTNKTDSGLHFTGSSAGTQQFLENSKKACLKWEEPKGTYIGDIPPEEIVIRRDSLQSDLNQLLLDWAKDEGVSNPTRQIMASKSKMTLYRFQQYFVTEYYKKHRDRPNIPVTLQQAIQDLPVDSVALAVHMDEYLRILSNHLRLKIYSDVAEEIKGLNKDSLYGKWAVICDNFIRREVQSPFLQTHFRGANIAYWARNEGATPGLIRLRADFLKSAESTVYTKSLAKSFGKWEALATGKPAPDFTGITANGEKFSLKDLKGKMVYIDIWATWCGPCRAEFPSSQKLIQEFKGNDQLVFLYVSIDTEVDDWKKSLKTKNVPQGMHINHLVDQPGSISKKYYLSGIPRYILINKDGTIIEAVAPKPSSKEIRPLLKGYLKES